MTATYTRSFQELREWMLAQIGQKDHFDLWRMGEKYEEFWSDINSAEMKRGYQHDEYVKENTPALCEMNLLTDQEMDAWQARFKAFHELTVA